MSGRVSPLRASLPHIAALVAAVLALALLEAGVAVRPAHAQESGAASITAADPLAGPIRVADTLKVVVADTADFNGEYRVDPDGTVTIPQAGAVPVQGLMPAAVADRIAKRLVDAQLLKSASVTVTIVGRKPREVTVNGAVNVQGRQQIHDGTLLSEVIETAGLQPAADLSRVVLNRAGQTITIDYKQFRNGVANSATVNPTLEDGDRIYIYSSTPSEGSIRIVGEIKDAAKPMLPITAGTTVGQAIQQAGGLTDYADRSGIFVVRSGQRIPVAYEQLLKGMPGSDIPLQDRDEIYVPRLDRPHAFTVTGAVHTPNTYPLTAPTTLLQAVADAGGPQEGARVNQVLLRRRAPNGAVLTRVMNLDRDTDAATGIQDGDYVEVPFPRRRPDAGSSVGGVVGILSGLAVIFGATHR